MKITRKKLVITIICAVVAISAAGGLYLSIKDDKPDNRNRHRQPLDPNLPNPAKMEPQKIIAYMGSSEFKQLPGQQKMNYFRHAGRKIMQYQMDKYFALPEEEKTEMLDEILYQMNQMRPERPEGQRQDNQNPNNQQNRRNRPAPQPSQMRARSERGTAAQRAQRQQFFKALSSRAEELGIEFRPPGGGRGPR